MDLTELKPGEKAVIKNIKADEELKHRLLSMGIQKNSEVALKGYAPGKKVLKIEANHSCIAIRDEEARKIEVFKK